MFCYKCGTELPDGVAFCHKCGTKIVVDDSVKAEPEQRNVTAKPVGMKQQQPNVVLSVPEKKRPRKLPVILGILALAIVSVGVYLGTRDENDLSNMTELTKTFTSESDDVSFQYPKAWKIVDSDDESVVVRLSNADIYSFIYVRKFADGSGDAGNLYDMDDEYFLKNFIAEGNVAESTSMVDINGFPAREVYYSVPDSNVGTVYYRTYLYAFETVVYRIDLVKKELNPIDVDRVFDAIMDSYTITAVPDESRLATDSSEGTVDRNVAYKEAYAEKVRELAAEDDTVRFALIDLTGNDIPELAVDHYGYGVSVFTWADGEIIPLMDYWPYGAGGNMGYEYIPGQNVIRNMNLDQAGAIVYESYMMVNDAGEIVSLFDEDISARYFRDINGNGSMDEGEYCEEPVYYYGDTEISKEEYAAYQIPGDFERITGDLPAEMILEELEGNDMTSGYPSDDILPEYYEPIENYWGLSGYYIGNTGQSTLSFSIYTSQEEGESEIGSADIYTDNGQHYSGMVIPIEKGVYKVIVDAGEEVLLVESSFDDVVALQLYVDGQFLEEYRMKEHYES